MQKGFFIPLFLLVQVIVGQQAVHNFGSLRLHNKGLVGFHTGFVNDGTFDSNLGLTGFYSDEESLFISGEFSPSFYDLELAVEGNLQLKTTIHIDNSLNFIYGNIQSNKNSKNVYTQFSENAFYEGATDLSKVHGYAAVDGQKTFSFPTGTENTLRPVHIKFIDGPFLTKCAYFQENPDFPKSFSKGFDTSLRGFGLTALHKHEFWNLTTSGMVQITLKWHPECDMESHVDDLENINIAGWSKKNGMWVNLGNFEYDGNISRGTVTSNTFNANDYEIFTFGFLPNLNRDSNHYAMTPNGDGVNDFFTLKLIQEYPSNKLLIYNRMGMMVYEKSNYKNEFNGFANKNTSQKDKVLLEGVYFYILDVKEHNLKFQGYIYLAK